MIARRGVKKGQILETIDPAIVLPSSPLKNTRISFFSVCFCRICGDALECADLPDDGIIQRVQLLPNFCDGKEKLRQGIKAGDWHYCSVVCKQKASDLYSLGGERRAEHDSTKQFLERIVLKQDPDMDDIALFLAAIIYCKLLEGDDSSARYKKFYEGCEKTAACDIHERVMECWVILRSEISASEQHSEDSKLLTSTTFNTIYKCIRRQYLHQIPAMHPLTNYIQNKLLNLPGDALKDSLDYIGVAIPGLDLLEYKDMIANASDTNSVEKISTWRKAVRLVQAVNGNILDDEELTSMFDKKSVASIAKLRRMYFAFCPDIDLQHSCLPDCIVEGDTDKGAAAVKLSLIALHDIKKDEPLTISRIDDLTGDIDERQAQLQRVFGSDFTCNCVRCNCERHWDDRDNFDVRDDSNDDSNDDGLKRLPPAFHWMQLKRIGDLAMQHAKYKVACDFYNLVLKVQPKNGDVLHARCASFLERGYFNKAQEMWREAYKVCPDHDGIALHVKKQDAYGQIVGSASTAELSSCASCAKLQVQSDSFITLIPSKGFVTKPDCPILSSEECAQAIQWAESAAESRAGGWTTSRHYAVPTTDIPIHEVPPLLEWFKGVLESRLRPLLAMQFGEDEVGIGGSGVFIHDAFVVRYDASGGQNHLPLHRDQSTHSFTIALNSLSDYDGGGTYIASIKRAVRPSKGGALSFRGDELLHGGDPVVSGRRYIIVAFCYVCKQERLLEEVPKLKKMKLDGLFHKPDNKNDSKTGGSFSFGFQF